MRWYYKDGLGAVMVDGDAALPQGARLISAPINRDLLYDGAQWVQPDLEARAARGRLTMSVARDVFARRAAEAGYITFDEATDWSAGNALPALARELLDAAPESKRGDMRFALLARQRIRRSAPEIAALAQSLGLTDTQVDLLFI